MGERDREVIEEEMLDAGRLRSEGTFLVRTVKHLVRRVGASEFKIKFGDDSVSYSRILEKIKGETVETERVKESIHLSIGLENAVVMVSSSAAGALLIGYNNGETGVTFANSQQALDAVHGMIGRIGKTGQ